MQPDLNTQLRAMTGATSLRRLETLQQLWSGYGEIVRYQLSGTEQQTVIVKHIRPPQQQLHPRGWNTDIGHQRKLHSYRVETEWYRNFAGRCAAPVFVPRCLGLLVGEQESVLVLQDLDASGFPRRIESVDQRELFACIRWLAGFHANFLGEDPIGLWPTGCYWHLDTRPEEWQKMPAGELKTAAAEIDLRLEQARFKTLVHGDAKLENFCFSNTGDQVAAVDFQYVGAGCGMKDLAYFMSSCLSEADCEQREREILEYYFRQLHQALKANASGIDGDQLEREWRELYAFAWADFYRFLAGWMPGHWKINHYSSGMVQRVLEQLRR